MRTARLITAAIAAAALAAAGPGAAGQVHHLTARDAVARPIPRPPTWPRHPQPITQIATLPDGRPIPQPPTWPLHPLPITQIATLPDGRPIPQPPTWPLHPHVIPPPDTVAQLPAIADRPAIGFDWASACVGAATTLAAVAVALAGAALLRRRRVGRLGA